MVSVNTETDGNDMFHCWYYYSVVLKRNPRGLPDCGLHTILVNRSWADSSNFNVITSITRTRRKIGTKILRPLHWFPTRLRENSPLVFFVLLEWKSVFGSNSFWATLIFRRISTPAGDTVCLVATYQWFSSTTTVTWQLCPLMWLMHCNNGTISVLCGCGENLVSNSKLLPM